MWNLADEQQIASIETPAAVNAVALVGDGKQVATGGADNIIRLWDLPATQPADAPKPVKELTGHTGRSRRWRHRRGWRAARLRQPGRHDSRVGRRQRQGDQELNHGAPVAAVAAASDGKRLASVGAAGTRSCGTSRSGKQVAELKGDLRATLKVGELTRAVALAKKHVELAKKDLEDANKRKKAEEENQKKSAEALTKAEDGVQAEGRSRQEGDRGKGGRRQGAGRCHRRQDQGRRGEESGRGAARQGGRSLEVGEGEPGGGRQDRPDDGQGGEGGSRESGWPRWRRCASCSSRAKQAAEKAVAEARRSVHGRPTRSSRTLISRRQKAIDEQTAAERTLDTAKRGVERAAEAVKKATEAIPGVEALVKAG